MTRLNMAFRSCAQSLERFAEALQRRAQAKIGVSLVRAHTPHTPQGRALKRRPGSLERARARALQRNARAIRYSAGRERRGWPREQHPFQTDFLSRVRSGLATPDAPGLSPNGPRRSPVSRPGRPGVSTYHFRRPRQHGPTSWPRGEALPRRPLAMNHQPQGCKP